MPDLPPVPGITSPTLYAGDKARMEPVAPEPTPSEVVPVAIVSLPVDAAKDTARGPAGSVVQPQESLPSLPAETTFQQDLTMAGQRTVNLMWEGTQMKVALSVVWVSLFVAAVLAIGGKVLGSVELQLASVVFIFGVANLVVGFYFGRTNHTKTGGIGPNNSSSR